MENENRIGQGKKSQIAKSGSVITLEIMERSPEEANVPDHLVNYIREGRTLFRDQFGNGMIIPPIGEPINKVSGNISSELPQSTVIVEPSVAK